MPAPGQGSFLRWLPAAAWMGLIFALSAQSEPLPGFLARWQFGVLSPSSIAHTAEYAVLTVLLVFALRRLSLRMLVLAALLAFAYALSDELHQALVPGRQSSAGDLALDGVGAFIGAALAAGLGMAAGTSRRRLARNSPPA